MSKAPAASNVVRFPLEDRITKDVPHPPPGGKATIVILPVVRRAPDIGTKPKRP
jgi:hypothetical protein